VPEVLSGGEIEGIGEPLRYPAEAMRTSENSANANFGEFPFHALG
jgi:hypothetical protein